MERISRMAALALLATSLAAPLSASAGEVFVPAHRTRDGQYVPPNVPPSSGGTHPVRRPGKGSSTRTVAAAERSRIDLLPPLFANARPIQR